VVILVVHCTMPTSHPRIQVTLDPEFATAVDRAASHLESSHGRAGLIRALALRGAEEISRQAESETRAQSQAIEELLACDFSQLSDIVARRESRLPATPPRIEHG
jgi:hypothetical protein